MLNLRQGKSQMMGQMMERQTVTLEKMAEKLAGSDRPKKDHVLAKYFRVDNFDGDRAKWEDWSFAFRRNVRSMSREAYDVMTDWEDRSEGVGEKLELTNDQERSSAELYDVLCQTCVGEALMIVKSVDDMEGIKAWQALCKKYRPKTRASAVRMMSEVVNPPKVKDLNQFEASVTKWEDMIKSLGASQREAY